MRIAFCVPSLGVDEGQGRADLEILRRVAAAGHTVDVFTSRAPAEVGTMKGVRLKRIPRLPAWQLGNLLIMLVWTTLTLRRKRYDAIHADPGMLAGRVDTMVAHTVSARWRMLPKEVWHEPGVRGAHAALAGRLKARLELRQFRRATVVLANSALTASHLAEAGVDPARIQVLPFGVESDRYRPPDPAERAAARIALGVPDDAFVVCFVGAHGPRKGLPVLIEALAGAGAHLIAAGDHRGAGTISQAAAAGVALTAPGKLSDVRTAYWASDVFVYPSRYDAFGMAVLEAMASGLPVLVSPHAGVSEVVSDGTGVVLREVEPGAIRAEVDALRADPGRMKALGRAARALAERRDWDIPAQMVLRAITSSARTPADRQSGAELPPM